MARTLAGFAALALLVGVSAARAEDQESRFTIHPSLLITLVGDDDPYLAQRDDGAFGAWFAPSLELGYRADFYEVQADLGADVRRYIDEGGLSEEFYRAIVHGEIGVLPGLTLRVSEAFAPEPEQISSPPDATQNLQQTNRVDTELRYWRELPGHRELLVGFRGAHFTSEDFNAVIVTDGNGILLHPDFHSDHWEGAGKLELQTPFGKRNSLYARSEFEYRDYTEFDVPDRAEFTILFGTRTRHFRNVEIDVAVGYGMVSFESADDLHRFVGEGSLRYRLPDGWTWRVSAANRFASDLAGNVFVETTGRMGIEKHFGELITASAAAFASRLENNAWNLPTNFFWGAEFRIEARVARHTTVAATYRHWDNAGNFSLDNFDQDRVALEIFYRR
jgi:hypothetical protein